MCQEVLNQFGLVLRAAFFPEVTTRVIESSGPREIALPMVIERAEVIMKKHTITPFDIIIVSKVD